ncbi:MAG: hypothetical protein RL199_1354 [Pseudomonadota bacterium]
MKYLLELLLAVWAAVVEASLPVVLGLATWRPLLVPVVAVRLGLVTGTLPGALLTLAAGLVHEAVCGLPTGVSTFALMVVQASSRAFAGGLGLAGRRVELTASMAGVLAWQLLLWACEHLLGPLDGAPTFAWLGAVLAATAASLPGAWLVFAAGRRLEPADKRPLGTLAGGGR